LKDVIAVGTKHGNYNISHGFILLWKLNRLNYCFFDRWRLCRFNPGPTARSVKEFSIGESEITV
jgi:hypothetical protein